MSASNIHDYDRMPIHHRPKVYHHFLPQITGNVLKQNSYLHLCYRKSCKPVIFINLPLPLLVPPLILPVIHLVATAMVLQTPFISCTQYQPCTVHQSHNLKPSEDAWIAKLKILKNHSLPRAIHTQILINLKFPLIFPFPQTKSKAHQWIITSCEPLYSL